MKSGSAFLLSASFAFISLFSSCVSTDVWEPQPSGDSENRVVLNLSAPDEIKTRADNGFKLRYVAKLYSGTDRESNNVTVQRQELVEGEKGEGGIENQMLFYVPVGSPYVIYVFADYIPSDYQKNPASGCYKDYFYDTTIAKNTVKMLSTPDQKGTNNLSTSFFNNDNYDCFGGVAALEEDKTEKEETFNLELHRLVAKVRLEDNSQFSGNFDAEISNFTYLSQYTLKKEVSDESGWAPQTAPNTIKIFNNKEIPASDSKEIFFFYTFASPSTVADEKPKFEVNIKDHSETTLANLISTGYITVKRNHITTIKGKLLPGIMADEPGLDQEETRDGPIILNLSVTENPWNFDEASWSAN